MVRGITRRNIIQGTAVGAATAALGHRSFAQDDDKPEITIGSHNYTEQFLNAEMVGLVLEDAGFPVNYEHNLGGTMVIHDGRIAGDIDISILLLGDGINILGAEYTDLVDADASPDEIRDAVYDFVKEGFQEEWNHHLLEPLGANNTWALTLRREDQEELGATKISDLEPYASDLSIAGSQEFMIREDGLPGMQEAYGFEFEEANGMESGLMYSALDNGDVDVIAAFSTDGRIQSLDFVMLEDDKNFFPPWHAVPVVRGELLEEAPEVEDIVNKLGGQLNNEIMAELNFRVDDGLEAPRDVAQDFLTQEGLLEGNND